ncbi:NAD(P)H-dependent oxidoreductase subunit E [Halomonas sp. McH1-25]|uniref:NAD(P)H-dependent oxidoreductase subunit E n=1 Tax=unclassified Halomonas TaxID=2609666 RepID=UPI001EF6B46F|nr:MULTISPECIES: NAD(P)H-dependent oxidoreductase subunit E [unclassified Halomonas]MCG7599760.1 NAD(P)H-dependent oxidoreductase subunit E [Halomonas sp. McH1-25]MCP1341656.1 NAD(P)H-dependent oxidoreductase subunit E [Halomonas sp. FL8]MCP1359814.1 NAD(P)H-dependent oxidoreductase subunit E [Halomonas sp. BBD45]
MPANTNNIERSNSLVETIVESHRHRPGALLPVLHEIQASFGFIPKDAVTPIADGLNLSRAEVHGVISFYHDFRYVPGPSVRVCMGEACQSMGSAALLESAKALFGDGVEPVYCVGNCACAPNVEIAHAYHGRMSPAKLTSLLAREVAA